MSTLSGTATAYCLDGVTVAFTGVATTDNELQSLDLRDNLEISKAKNAAGQIFARGASGKEHILEVEVMIKDIAGSPTRLTAQGKIATPADLGLVTLAGFGNNIINGTWNYEGGTYRGSNGEFGRLRLTLSRSGAAPAALALIS